MKVLLLLLAIAAVGILPGCTHGTPQLPAEEDSSPTSLATYRATAINLAKQLFAARASEGMDFTAGPCLDNNLMTGWVADIAHVPRQEIDDLPENQCAAFVNGTARHFVELDPDGNLIRAE